MSVVVDPKTNRKAIVNVTVTPGKPVMEREAFLEGYIGMVSIGLGWGCSAPEPAEAIVRTITGDKSETMDSPSEKLMEAANKLDKVKDRKAGVLYLVPEEVRKAIGKVENRARGCIERLGIRFGRDRFHFIHSTKAPEVMLEMDQLKEEYYETIEEKLLVPYDDIKKQMQEEHPERWPFMVGHYPTVDQIRARRYFRFTLREMLLPKELELVDPRAMIARINADREYAKKLDMDAAEVKQRLERQMRDQMEAKKEEFEFLVKDTVEQLRGKVVDVFENILSRRQGGKEVGERQLTSIREAISYVEDMDFVDDSQFREKLEAVKTLVNSGKEFETSDKAAAELDTILRGTVDFAKNTMETSVGQLTQSYFSKRKLSL